MDSLGAIAGPLAAAPLIVAVGYRWLFALSVLPGLLAAAAVLALVAEAPRPARASAAGQPGGMLSLARSPGPFRRLLAGIGLYGLGNFSATLLILRATQLLHAAGRPNDRAAAIAVLLYAAHNAANALVAYPAGTLADRLGRRPILVGGFALFALLLQTLIEQVIGRAFGRIERQCLAQIVFRHGNLLVSERQLC